MKAVSSKSTYDYVCKCDRELPEAEQTVCEMGYLTLEQEAFLDDKLGFVTDSGYSVNLGSSNLTALHLGLKGMRNFNDENGEPIVLQRDDTKAKKLPGVGRPWKESQLSKIAKVNRLEMAEVIKNGGEITEEEAKN
jgi:hypothetical protein